MAHSGVPGASLLSSNPKFNPLGSFGTALPGLAAGASEILAPGNPFGIAALATQGGFDLSQGNTLGGLLSLGGAGLSAVPDFASFGGSVTPATAGTGTEAASGATSGGSSLSDFLSNAGTGISNTFSNLGSDITSGANKLMSLLGFGESGTTPAAATATGTAASGQPALDQLLTAGAPAATGTATGVSPTAAALLANPSTTTIPAGLTATPTIAAGGAAPSTGLLSTISNFTSAHPFLTLGGAALGSQLLSPTLQNLTGSGLTTQEQALLNQEQPGLNAANALISSEQTGVLPPGAQDAVNQALNADIEQIRSRYAQIGDSGSSAEAQDIATAQQQAAANAFGLSNQATQTGLSALGLNQSVYNTLVQDQLSKQQSLQNAFASLFSSIGLGTALAGAKTAAP